MKHYCVERNAIAVLTEWDEFRDYMKILSTNGNRFVF
jgi:hypothetical protein